MKSLVAGASVLLLSAAAIASPITNVLWSSSAAFTDTRYVDFAVSSTAGHTTYTPSFGMVPNLVNTHTVILGSTTTTGLCFQVETLQASSATSDTRIWVAGTSTSSVSLSDDEGPGNFSIGRVWVQQAGGINPDVNVDVAAYNTANNGIDFNLKITKLNVTEAACTTGQTLPWASFKGGTRTTGQTT